MSSESKIIMETADVLLQRVQEIKVNAKILLHEIIDMMRAVDELNQILDANTKVKNTEFIVSNCDLKKQVYPTDESQVLFLFLQYLLACRY